jgi:hypothetical protein
MLSDDLSLDTVWSDDQPRRFAIAWRNTRLRRISPVGMLEFDGDSFEFSYLSGVDAVQDFRPFIGFPDFSQVYEARTLWPFFALRVMDKRRPDYPRYLGWLGLTPEASPLDILSRSGGERKGDTVQLIEEPRVAADGTTESVFLVRGARYATEEYASVSAAEALMPGDSLMVKTDASNTTNSSALLITTMAESPVGWVPDLLIAYTNAVFDGNGQMAVVRNNGTDAPWHLRLLAKVAGRVRVGYRPFSGTQWRRFGTASQPKRVEPIPLTQRT